jgi:hypothetical protein
MVKQPEIFPNPASDWLQINNFRNEARIQIFDLSGKLVLEKIITENQLNIGHLSKGFYYVQIVGKDYLYKYKLIKQ